MGRFFTQSVLISLVTLCLASPDVPADQSKKRRSRLKAFEEAVERKTPTPPPPPDQRQESGNTNIGTADRRDNDSGNSNRGTTVTTTFSYHRPFEERGFDEENPTIPLVVSTGVADARPSVNIFTGMGGVLFGIWPEGSQYYNSDLSSSKFSFYPYSEPNQGLYARIGGYGSAINVMGHYLHDSPDLHGYSVRSKFSPAPALTVETLVAGFTESFDDGDNRLAFYDFYLNYNRIRHPMVTLWWGIGVKGLQGEKSYYGPGFNAGLEVYPTSPFSLYGAFNAGRLNVSTVHELLLRMNVHLHRSVIFLGYQRFKVKSVSLGGIVAGAGLYF